MSEEQLPETKADRTRDRILESAKKEFVNVSFQKASLRRIAADAGVTTGSIYRYFSSKDDLFYAIVGPAQEAFFALHQSFSEQAFASAAQDGGYDKQSESTQIMAMLDMVYADFDAFYLSIACAEGSVHDDFQKRFVAHEEQVTFTYLETMKQAHASSWPVNRDAIHAAVEATVAAMLEPIRHRVTRQQAVEEIRFLAKFFNDGWAGVEQAIRDAGSNTM